MEDLGDEAVCYPDKLHSHEEDKNNAFEEMTETTVKATATQIMAKVPDSFVNDDLIDESFRESYIERHSVL
jgi:hypothetical protein